MFPAYGQRGARERHLNPFKDGDTIKKNYQNLEQGVKYIYIKQNRQEPTIPTILNARAHPVHRPSSHIVLRSTV